MSYSTFTAMVPSDDGSRSLGWLPSSKKDDDDKENDFCRTKGSLHELTFRLANYSSPVGSPSYLKMKQILDSGASKFYINCEAPIFSSVQENIVQMLQGYGLTRVPRSPLDNDNDDAKNENDTIMIEMSFYGRKRQSNCVSDQKQHCPPRIILQAEQLATVWRQYESYLRSCHETPNCIIWDFSDNNYRVAATNGISDSFLLLPIMTQSRLGQPDTVPPLKERTVDLSLFGLITKRRAMLKEKLQEQGLQQNKNNFSMLIQTEKNGDRLRESYLNSKVCLIVHSYIPNASAEYHRLSEVAPMGCILVVEDHADTVARTAYQTCGGVILANYSEIPQVLSYVLDNYETWSNNLTQYMEWWKRGIRWGDVLTTIFPRDEEDTNRSNAMEQLSDVDADYSSSKGRDEPADPGSKKPSVGSETTILVTSNLIPAHPSISMINETIHSCFKHIRGLSPNAPILVAVDFPREPYDIIKESHNNETDLHRFDAFIRTLLTEFGPRIRVRIARKNRGLSWSVFNTLPYVETDFIYLVQHDMPFIRDIDHANLIKSMREYPNDLRIVRFPLFLNYPIRSSKGPCFGMKTPVDYVNGLNFTKTAGWSDK